MFEHYLRAWHLSADGEPIVTPGSHLLPVRWQGVPAMLKIAHTLKKTRGRLLSWITDCP